MAKHVFITKSHHIYATDAPGVKLIVFLMNDLKCYLIDRFMLLPFGLPISSIN